MNEHDSESILSLLNSLNDNIQFTNKDLKKIKRFYKKKLKGHKYNFDQDIKSFVEMKRFKINENVHEKNIKMSYGAHLIMRATSTLIMKSLMKDFLKIDHNDDNVDGDITKGNIGTSGRIMKMLTGSNKEDTNELLSGRWNKPPRMARFKAKKHEKGNPVFVKSRLDAVCSHHLVSFNDAGEDSLCVIGYIPEDYIGGISKINRFMQWAASRGWLQEDLTKYVANTIKKRFKTKSVFVNFKNIRHGCASNRGIKDRAASTSTYIATGKFETNPELIPNEFK